MSESKIKLAFLSNKEKKRKRNRYFKFRDKIKPIPILYIISIAYIILSLYTFSQSFMANQLTDANIWGLVPIGLMVAAVLVSLLMLYKQRNLQRIVAIQSLGMSLSTAFSYVVVMSYGNLIQFTGGFMASIACITMASLSLDLFLGRMDAAQSLKPMCLIIAVELVILVIFDYYLDQNSVPLYSLIIPFIFLALLFVYHDRRVMKRTRYRDIYFPRIQFLAATIFLFGLMMVIRPDFNNSKDMLDQIGLIVLLCTGLFFLVYRWVDKITSLAVMCMAIASYAICYFATEVFSPDIFKVLTAVIVMITASLCIIMAVLLYAGDKYNTVRLKFIVLIIAILYAIPVLLNLRTNPDMVFNVNRSVNQMMFALLVIATYIALTDPAIRYYNTKYRLEYNVKVLNYTVCSIPDAYIFRKDLRNLFDESKWRDNDPGSMMKEKSVIIHIGDYRSMLSIQKWNDTGKMTGELAHNKAETYVQALRFTIDRMVLDGTVDDCSMLTMYDDKGFFTRIMVADEVVGSKVGRFHKFIYLLVGHDPNTGKVVAGRDRLHKYRE